MRMGSRATVTACVFAGAAVVAVTLAICCAERADGWRRRFDARLDVAVRLQRYSEVHELLAAGANPNTIVRAGGGVIYDSDRPWQKWLNAVMRKKRAPVKDSYGILFGADWVCAKELLEFGADPDPTEPSMGSTPLMLAASRGDYNLAKVLLENGASVTRGDNYGRGALAYARGDENPFTRPSRRVVALLFERGAR